MKFKAGDIATRDGAVYVVLDQIGIKSGATWFDAYLYMKVGEAKRYARFATDFENGFDKFTMGDSDTHE